MSKEIEAIISKGDWDKIEKGYLLGVNGIGSLTFYSEGNLHHEFGDYPEEKIVRIKISKIE
ncbi:MAG: hypothetical protein KAQ87_03430 [Candidatus Pacebacteria bacterium]|nr:hypothetical protein [Candidatus Paceibacterota bacterium]